VDEQKPENGPRKRPYMKPEIQSSELFERRSLVCGTQPQSRPPCGTIHQSV
jgi:hypothetical protein